MSEWENISGDGYSTTKRLKVPDGWIVKSQYRGYADSGVSVHQIFIKDPEHEWKLNNEE